jgi:REP element-mobilizing transposase RayT
MAVKRKIPWQEGVYFITFTCHQWLPLIEMTQSYDQVYKWFDYLKSRGHLIVGYVIMPNHLHVLIAFRCTEASINTIIGNGKRFMAYEIVRRLSVQGNHEVLDRLQNAVTQSDRIRNKRHEVWEDSFDWKMGEGQEFMQQKLDYMHDNPCRSKWNLAASPVDYPHSSAGFYIEHATGLYPVLNYMQLEDIDLTKRT